MVTGPMFANIRWGTYVFFAALNVFLIWPVVYFYFPETKGKSLEEVCRNSTNVIVSLTIQLDVMFAYAHYNHKNPVKLSLNNDMPAPGTHDAEAVLGNVGKDTRTAHTDKPTVVQQS
jgi:hypothetical protein